MQISRLPNFDDLINLFFPDNCRACSHKLMESEEVVCLHCQDQLAKTDFHLHEPNLMSKLFWGRIDIQYALAAYYFFKKSSLQKLIHQLKYHGKTEIGHFAGKEFGARLKSVGFDKKFDLIMPVPLHRKKKKLRGYNQSDSFAESLSKKLNTSWDPDALVRNIYSTSQTKKSKYQRWENVNKIFSVKKPEAIADKRILLVDDIVTTGSTLEACAIQLHKANAKQVSLAVIGFAHY